MAAATRPRRTANVVFIVATICAGLSILARTTALFFTEHSQTARAIAWLGSDVDDYKRFPMRVVENARPTFEFLAPSEEMLQLYSPSWENINNGLSGRWKTATFAQ